MIAGTWQERECGGEGGRPGRRPDGAVGLTARGTAGIVAGMRRRPQFDELEASELFCPRCRAARAVRKVLLLTLPTGNKYDYRCTVCGTSLGGKDDNDPSEFRSILLGR